MEYKLYIIDHCLDNVNQQWKTNNLDATKQCYLFQIWTDSGHRDLGTLHCNKCIFFYTDAH